MCISVTLLNVAVLVYNMLPFDFREGKGVFSGSPKLAGNKAYGTSGGCGDRLGLADWQQFKIQRPGNFTAETRFGGTDEVIHFSRRHVVKIEVWVVAAA